jgi:hypothetical protein
MSDRANRIFRTSAWRELCDRILGLRRGESDAVTLLRSTQKRRSDALCKGS